MTPVPDDILYFDPNANSKSEWASIKSHFHDQAAATTSIQEEQEQEQVAKVVSANNLPTVAVPVTGQDSDKVYGFNNDNDFTDTLNDVLTNGDFGDVVSTAIHDAYQNGTINSDCPPIVGTSSVMLGKRRRMIVEEETDEKLEVVPSSTTITAITAITTSTSTSGANANANVSDSNSITITPTPVPTSRCMCTKCGCNGRNPVGYLDPPDRPFGIKRAILDVCAERCNHMEPADNLPIGMRLCVWNDAAEFNCLRCLGQSRTAVCLSRNINIPGPLPLINCCPLIRSARRNRHLRNFFPKCYEAGCRVRPPPLQRKGPPIDPKCWTVVLERRRIDFYLRCQFATAEWLQKSFADSCKVMVKNYEIILLPLPDSKSENIIKKLPNHAAQV